MCGWKLTISAGFGSGQYRSCRATVFGGMLRNAAACNGFSAMRAPVGIAVDPSVAKQAHPLAHYAIAEVEKRGLPSASAGTEEARAFVHAAQAFRLGYAPPGWDGLATFLKQHGVSPSIGERAGLLVAGNRGHYDRFRHRLMFAVMDTLGRVVAFSGRALAAPSKEDLAKHAPSAPSYDIVDAVSSASVCLPPRPARRSSARAPQHCHGADFAPGRD